MAARRNKDGVVEPVKVEKSYAETLPTAASLSARKRFSRRVRP